MDAGMVPLSGDYNNVVGLSVSRVHRELRHLYDVR